jgi:hypothetical protein
MSFYLKNEGVLAQADIIIINWLYLFMRIMRHLNNCYKTQLVSTTRWALRESE